LCLSVPCVCLLQGLIQGIEDVLKSWSFLLTLSLALGQNLLDGLRHRINSVEGQLKLFLFSSLLSLWVSAQFWMGCRTSPQFLIEYSKWKDNKTRVKKESKLPLPNIDSQTSTHRLVWYSLLSRE